eukprot:4522739-Amphidinium_carterae.1
MPDEKLRRHEGLQGPLVVFARPLLRPGRSLLPSRVRDRNPKGRLQGSKHSVAATRPHPCVSRGGAAPRRASALLARLLSFCGVTAQQRQGFFSGLGPWPWQKLVDILSGTNARLPLGGLRVRTHPVDGSGVPESGRCGSVPLFLCHLECSSSLRKHLLPLVLVEGTLPFLWLKRRRCLEVFGPRFRLGRVKELHSMSSLRLPCRGGRLGRDTRDSAGRGSPTLAPRPAGPVGPGCGRCATDGCSLRLRPRPRAAGDAALFEATSSFWLPNPAFVGSPPGLSLQSPVRDLCRRPRAGRQGGSSRRPDSTTLGPA